MKDLLQNPWIRNSALVIAGLFLGWILFANGTPDATNTESHQHEQASTSDGQETIWTCSMHPQVRQSEPGSCPICGMELIPADSENGQESESSGERVRMSPAAAQIAEIQTSRAQRQPAVQEMMLPGKIAVDERRISSVTAHFPGRIKTLLVNYTGEYVEKGQMLARIYSPALITAQKELIEASRYRESNPALYEAARRKLELWELPEAQIHAIEHNQKVLTEVPIVSPVSGYVTERKINREDHVREGTVMYEIADLSTVWGIFEAYEADISTLNEGDTVTFRVDALPGKTYQTPVTYIDPVLQADTRTVRVRTEISNSQGNLKPEMIAQARVRSELYDGNPVVQVPASAVMWTGQRSLVYVRDPESEGPSFEAREVALGQRVGDHYVILEGLSEGEEVVTHGTFKLDSAAQLAGKTSMMNRPDQSASSVMEEAKMEADVKPDEPISYPSAFVKSFKSSLESYFSWKDALVAADSKAGAEQAQRWHAELKELPMTTLSEQQHQQWMTTSSVLMEKLKTAAGSDQIEAQRKAFAQLSEQLISWIRRSEITGVGFQQHCPMAFGSGADWISQEDQVRNPYYGDQMLTCGSVVREL
jgi:Cu(I)/Ag(I) efflux system membrane fusion protein